MLWLVENVSAALHCKVPLSSLFFVFASLVLKCMGPFPCCPGYFNTTGLARWYWLPALGKGPAINLDSHSQSNKIGFLGVSPISGCLIKVFVNFQNGRGWGMSFSSFLNFMLRKSTEL